MAADLALYTTVISLLAGIWLLLRVFPTTALKFRRGFAALKSRLRQTGAILPNVQHRCSSHSTGNGLGVLNTPWLKSRQRSGFMPRSFHVIFCTMPVFEDCTVHVHLSCCSVVPLRPCTSLLCSKLRRPTGRSATSRLLHTHPIACPCASRL
jgi:hypothetical protein